MSQDPATALSLGDRDKTERKKERERKERKEKKKMCVCTRHMRICILYVCMHFLKNICGTFSKYVYAFLSPHLLQIHPEILLD